LEKKWFEYLDLAKIGVEERYRLFDYLVSKHGRDFIRSSLGISRYTVYRIMKRQVRITDGNLRKLLSLISEDELKQIIGARENLIARGLLREDGTIDYSLALELLSLASSDQYLKSLIIRFVVENFREDVKKALGIYLSNIVFRWSDDFAEFMRSRKKRKKVRRPDTIAYYKRLFMKYLEGRRLSMELIDYVINHSNKWLRNVFRHYIQYLYFNRKISPETFGWIMEVVPSRSYRQRIRIYRIDVDKLYETMEFLRENHELYYLYYLIMYYSGIRLEHVVRFIAEYNPMETVEITSADIVSRRLVCYEDRGFCRYYLGLGETGKPCEWIWFPMDLLELVNKYGRTKRKRSKVSDYARNYDLLRPKYLRKLHWRIGTRVIQDKDILRFIQSRFGELGIAETRYGDLLTRTDSEYPKLMHVLRKGLEDPEYLKQLLAS